MIKYKKFSTLLFILSIALNPLSAQFKSHPDQVYPTPEIIGNTNDVGINTLTGQLNLSFPLASIESDQLSYSVGVFHNSISSYQAEIGDNHRLDHV